MLLGIGAVDSAVTVTGLATSDTLLSVQKVILDSLSTITSVTDVTSISSITGTNELTVTGAAHTAKTLFMFTS
jgi:hypothetical protein